MPSVSPVIIDCDTGRDDALAIWLALALELPLAAVIASYGNTNLDNVVANSAGVLSLAGANHIPLLKGASEPLIRHIGYENVTLPRQQTTGNGLCNITLTTHRTDYQTHITVAEQAEILRNIVQKNGKIDYIILGPATNFALLCEHLKDDLSTLIHSVTMLGGKSDAFWTKNDAADFNIVCDPEAVNILLKTDIKKQFVTLDTTWDITLSPLEIDALKSSSVIGAQARDIMSAHVKYFAPEPIFRFHDPTVILLYNRPEIFKPSKLWVETKEANPSFGRLYMDASEGRDAFLCDYHNIDRIRLRNEMLDKLGLANIKELA